MCVHVKGYELLIETDSFSILLGDLKALVFFVVEKKNIRNVSGQIGSSPVKTEIGHVF